MNSDSPASAAQRQLDAYNAHDLEAFLAVYHDNCVVRAMPSGETLMEGKEAMRARYGALFESHPDLHASLNARIEHKSFAIDHEEVVGLRENETVYAVAMYEVREDLIQSVWFLREGE